MILADSQIRERLLGGDGLSVGPMLDDDQFQPCSIDLELGREIYIPERDAIEVADPDEPIELGPDTFVLGHTREHISIPDDLLGWLTGRSTTARRGVAVHLMAGWVDPGFEGQLVLELQNFWPTDQVFYPGDRVAQIGFLKLDAPAENPYGSEETGNHYQGQTGARPAARDAHDEQ